MRRIPRRTPGRPRRIPQKPSGIRPTTPRRVCAAATIAPIAAATAGGTAQVSPELRLTTEADANAVASTTGRDTHRRRRTRRGPPPLNPERSTETGLVSDQPLPLDEPATLAVATDPIDAQLTPPDAAETLELIAPDDKRLNVYAGVDAVTQYVSRGLVFADEFSIQPWIELDASLARPETGPLTSVSLFAGNWNNITGSGPEDGRVRTGATATVENWYEADLYGGVRLTWFGVVQTSLRYNWYTSPANSFDQIHELDARVSLDDTAFWSEQLGIENFSLTPNVRVARELHDSGGPEQWYIAPRLSPTLTVEALPLDPSFTVPLAFGFGADGQYVDASGDERTFGFFQTGLHVSVPIDVLPEGRGGLTATAGVDVIILSDDGLAADGDRHETVFRFGVSYAY